MTPPEGWIPPPAKYPCVDEEEPLPRSLASIKSPTSVELPSTDNETFSITLIRVQGASLPPEV